MKHISLMRHPAQNMVFPVILLTLCILIFTTARASGLNVGDCAASLPPSRESGKAAVLIFGSEEDAQYAYYCDLWEQNNRSFQLILISPENEIAAEFGFSKNMGGAVLLDENDVIQSITYEKADSREKAAEFCGSLLRDYSAADGTFLYMVHVLDAEGNPIQKAYVQFCDGSSCRMEKTDETGTATLQELSYAYEVHVIKVPSGYEIGDASCVMWENGGEITFIAQIKP